ncbi:MAG: hypothetical protein ACNA8W_10215 [Bradymonadaceae bacterium]
MKRVSIVLVILLGLLFVAGCDPEREARTLSFPQLDETAPFPELSEARRSSGGEGKQSAFERAISRALEGESDAEEAGTVSIQTVPLAGRLVADIPLRFEEWQWASESGRTIIVHQLSGEAADAFILVESFGELVNRFPSQEMLRFQKGLDPAISGGFDPLSMVVERMAMADPQMGASVGSMVAAFRAMSSPTYGLGMGYRTTPKSFTGWRWVGNNDSDISLRLARSRGVWGPQLLPNPEMIRGLQALGEESPELAEFADHMQEIQQKMQQNQVRVPQRTAYMIVGNATSDHKTGLHIAIFCAASPRCPVARELADFLAGVRAPGPGEAAHLRAQAGQSPEDLAESVGIFLAPRDDIRSTGEIEGLVRGLGL